MKDIGIRSWSTQNKFFFVERRKEWKYPLGPSGALWLWVWVLWLVEEKHLDANPKKNSREKVVEFLFWGDGVFFLRVKKYTQAWEQLLFSVNYWRTFLNSAPRTSLGLQLDIRWLDLSSPGTGVAAGVQMGPVERRGAVCWGLLWSATSASAGRCPQGAPLQQSHPEEALPGSGHRG